MLYALHKSVCCFCFLSCNWVNTRQPSCYPNWHTSVSQLYLGSTIKRVNGARVSKGVKCVCVCLLKKLAQEFWLDFPVWAAGKAWGYRTVQTDASYYAIALHIVWHVLSLSAAFLGDIALDEEDLRSFKVDRIIDLAARTVQVVNRTNTGNNNRQKDLWGYSMM